MFIINRSYPDFLPSALMNIAAITMIIPISADNDGISLYIIIPKTVAAIGSAEAMTAAVLFSVPFNPDEYRIYGRTEAHTAKNTEYPIIVVFSENIFPIASISAVKAEKTAANANDQPVIATALYPLLIAARLNMLYRAYPMAEPAPYRSPAGVTVSASPINPVTSTSPVSERKIESIFRRVIFSLKNNADIIITKIGDVYRRIAAAESDMTVTALK